MHKKIGKINVLAILVAMLFVIMLLAACGDKSEKYSLPDVAEGSEFKITLDAHGGTAYSWNYEIKPSSGIEFVSQEYVPTNDDPSWTGGGEVIYTFKAVKAGSYKIEFGLSISWESESPTELKTYQIKVISSN